jgi:hypothetical protein
MESNREIFWFVFVLFHANFVSDLFQRPFMRAREVYIMGGKDDGGNTSTEEKEYVSDSDAPHSLLGAEEESPSKGKGKKFIRPDMAKSRPSTAKIVNPKAPKVKIEPEDAASSLSKSDKEANPIGTQCRLPDSSLLNLYVL